MFMIHEIVHGKKYYRKDKKILTTLLYNNRCSGSQIRQGPNLLAGKLKKILKHTVSVQYEDLFFSSDPQH